MRNKTVFLGLSGGVDSSVAALLLKKSGYKVIGAFMKNYSDTKNPLTLECNYLEDKKIAQKVCAILKIPFVFIDSEKEYKKFVLNPMFKSYKAGLTPNPDISCNTIIKFPILWKYAKKYKADLIATGHYARIKKSKKGYQLLAGKDKLKDQSYFLYELSQFDLAHTLFPIGNLKKSEVRNIAKKSNLPNWNKLGSRGICFVGKTNMQKFLKTKIKPTLGKVLDHEGKILGTHLGIVYYTIGQRVGPHIGINIEKASNLAQKKFFVANKLKNNTLIVAPEGHVTLKKSNIRIKNLHLINEREKIPFSLKVRIRHLGDLNPGKLIKSNSRYTFKLNKPLEGIAPGQSIVLYSKSRVIGGGEILSVEK